MTDWKKEAATLLDDNEYKGMAQSQYHATFHRKDLLEDIEAICRKAWNEALEASAAFLENDGWNDPYTQTNQKKQAFAYAKVIRDLKHKEPEK